jgi:sugar phosphate permease
MSLWATAVYVVRVRTNVIVLLARAAGDYFLAGVGTFGVVFATAQYHLSQGVADVALLALGSGALGGVLLAGRLSDALLRRGRINGRVWVAILGHLLAPVPLLPAFLTHSRWVALPLFSMGAFFLAGTQPALDAIRVDVIVPGLRGRAEAIRQVLRTAVEGGAPLVVGLLAGVLAGAAGLRLAFLVTLPLLVVNGLLLLLALRTYPHDVSAALASAERFRQRGAPEAGAGRTP